MKHGTTNSTSKGKKKNTLFPFYIIFQLVSPSLLQEREKEKTKIFFPSCFSSELLRFPSRLYAVFLNGDNCFWLLNNSSEVGGSPNKPAQREKKSISYTKLKQID
jgi:hypothetical protein